MTRAEQPVAEALRAAMARGDRMLARSRPVLAQMVVLHDHSLLAEDIVARVRAMLAALAAELLRRQAEAAGEKAREEFIAVHADELVERLAAQGELVAHLHALAHEWRLAVRLEAGQALDPVLSPLLQELVGHADADLASAAMACLAAQARFAQTQRRMELSLTELPADLFHEVLLAWRTFAGEPASAATAQADERLRQDYEEGAGRLALIARLVTSLDARLPDALQIERAGTALFLTALALRSGQSREQAALSSNPQLAARLVLGLRAAGLRPLNVETQALRIFPDIRLPFDLDSIGTREAAEWLAQGPGYGEG